MKPVQGDSGEALLARASRAHAGNYNMAAAVGRFEFSDETGQVRQMSTYARREQITRSGAAIYSISGWYDGALMNSAIKRFLSVRTPGSRLILGPWSHQGENLSPFATRLRDFDHTADVIQFFDQYLKAAPSTGHDSSAAVRYYTVGEERWKTAATWPPPGTRPHALHLAANGALAAPVPNETRAADSYRVDLTTGSGQETRWNNMTALDMKHALPRDRRERDRRLLVYDGAPLTADLEVTGHPEVTLFVASTEPDGALFVYLEDVDEQGTVRYVTEGMLRVIQRRVHAGEAPYVFPMPYRTFAKGDVWPLEPGVIAELSFDLFPICYLFRRGHAIRVAIAGADADHFATYPSRAPTLTVFRDAAHPSRITLPVMAPHLGHPPD